MDFNVIVNIFISFLLSFVQIINIPEIKNSFIFIPFCGWFTTEFCLKSGCVFVVKF